MQTVLAADPSHELVPSAEEASGEASVQSIQARVQCPCLRGLYRLCTNEGRNWRSILKHDSGVLQLPIYLNKSAWVLPFLALTGDMHWWLERSFPWQLIPTLQTKLLRQNCCWWHCGLNKLAESSKVLNMFKEAACDHSFRSVFSFY